MTDWTPEHVNASLKELRTAIARIVVGQEAAIDLMLIALLSQGHVLLEGVPGTGKTLLARTFAKLIKLQFGRIQFTPDLMPGDLVGSNLFDFQTSRFTLVKGPIFTELLLADEINRTPPKTQSALLEAMQERRVTLDGTSHNLGDGFMVVATQNPIEQEGTYPLPEAQLDRFLFRIRVGYPPRDLETQMVRLHGHQTIAPNLDTFGLEPLLDLNQIRAMRDVVAHATIADAIVHYIVDLVRETRSDAALLTGASPRAANMLATAARAHATLAGRNYVVPDDVKALLIPTLEHRLVLSPSAEIDGTTGADVLRRIVERIPVPR